MAVEQDNREGRRARVALLDDVRARRARKPSSAPAAFSTEDSDPFSEDSFGYTHDLASLLDEGQADEPTAAATADAILAEHHAARPELRHAADEPAITDGKAVVDDQQTGLSPERAGYAPPADEILEAISAHHEREQHSTRHPAPRGSADLEPAATRPRRARPGSSTERQDAGHVRRVPRRVLAAGAAIAIAIAIPVLAIAGSSPHARPGSAAHLDFGSIVSKTLTAAARTSPKPAAPKRNPAHRTTRRHQARAATQLHAGTHAAVSTAIARRSAVSSASRTPVVASVSPAPPASSTSSSGSSDSGSGSSGSAPPASSSAQTSGSQPTGPSGTAGGTVGGNCNPKCS
jgi:hypothetical protein